jgi:hypothetical protein
MAIIYCTQKFETVVGKTRIVKSDKYSPLGNWNANVFMVNKKNCVILMNDISYYSVLLIDFKKIDLMNFHEVFAERFFNQLEIDDISFPSEFTYKITKELQPIFLTTNNNRKVLGAIQDATLDMKRYITEDYSDNIDYINIDELNSNINEKMISVLGKKKRGCGYPNDAIQELLNKFCA